MKDLDAPSVSGKAFSFLVWLSFTRFGQLVVLPQLMKKAGLFLLSGDYIPEDPLMDVQIACPPPMEEDHALENLQLIQRLLDEESGRSGLTGFRFPSVHDFRKAYQEGRCTPVDVANAILDAIRESNKRSPPLRAIVDHNEEAVRRAAQESQDRWRDGKPLSFLDGVPIAVKAEFHTEPYSYRCGSLFRPMFADGLPESHLVKNFKQAGAVIIGMANMHEFGTGTLGSNPNHFNLTPRNPYNTECYSGGSSSGSAVSVAAGLCPISLGADGGGSIRTPAALCGLVGIKPTIGLLKSAGSMPIAHSLSCPGPLCGSVLDAIVAMDILSKNFNGKTVLPLQGIGVTTLSGLKVGVYREFFNHCDTDVQKVCEPSLQVLESLGASIVDIKIPELEESRIALIITIFSEFANGLACDVDKNFDLMNLETLLVLTCGFNIRSMDFLNAQKQRARAMTFLKHIFEEVDVIVTPTTACVAPKIDKDALPRGKSMAKVSGKLNRHLCLANLTGNPAISYPIGLSSDNLPVGLQLIGKWYDENTLLKVAWALEKSNHFPLTKPPVFYDVLKTATSM